MDEAMRYMEEGYCGEYDSLTDYVEQFIEDCYSDSLKDLPEFIRYHIDYEEIASDMDLGGDVFSLECEGKVHVFRVNILVAVPSLLGAELVHLAYLKQPGRHKSVDCETFVRAIHIQGDYVSFQN